MADDKPIIVIKKKGGHGGHHGGAWKVAYADFVTAMMAFFMVMWLVNSASSPTRENIASYFRKPGIFDTGSGSPLMIGAAGILPDAPPPKPEEKKKSMGTSQERLNKKTGTDIDEGKNRITDRGDKGKGMGDQAGLGSTAPTDPSDLDQPNFKAHGISNDVGQLQTLTEKIEKEIADSPELKKLVGIVDVKIDADGLNIEIMDTEKSSMFSLGSARVLPEAADAFKKLGTILAGVSNSIDIVGHTDAKPFPGKTNGYSNWELSSDRANAARRLLLSEGIAPSRITSVVGRADKELKKPDAPLDPSNRRITLKMRFNSLTHVNLAKDPSALKNLKVDEQKFQEKEAEKVHSLSTKDVLEGNKAETSKPKEKGTISLPDENSPQGNPDLIGRDKIFGDNPVIGPTDHFANY